MRLCEPHEGYQCKYFMHTAHSASSLSCRYYKHQHGLQTVKISTLLHTKIMFQIQQKDEVGCVGTF